MIIRSLHAGKPFTLSRHCIDFVRYELCTGINLIVVNEVDVGEVLDITVYRMLAMFTEGGFLDKMLLGALTNAMQRFSVPNAHADISDSLRTYMIIDNLPSYGFVLKPATIAVIPQYRYIGILRESQDKIDYIDSVVESAEKLVAMKYLVATLAYVVYINIDRLAETLNVPSSILHDIMSSHKLWLDYAISEFAYKLVDELRRHGIGLDDNAVYKIVRLAYSLVEEGRYPRPVLASIGLYRRGLLVAEGCEAAKQAYDFLPEQDQLVVKKYCPTI